MKPDHCMCIQYRSICSLRTAQGAGEPQTLALYVCTVRYCTSQAGIQTHSVTRLAPFLLPHLPPNLL